MNTGNCIYTYLLGENSCNYYLQSPQATTSYDTSIPLQQTVYPQVPQISNNQNN